MVTLRLCVGQVRNPDLRYRAEGCCTPSRRLWLGYAPGIVEQADRYDLRARRIVLGGRRGEDREIPPAREEAGIRPQKTGGVERVAAVENDVAAGVKRAGIDQHGHMVHGLHAKAGKLDGFLVPLKR